MPVLRNPRHERFAQLVSQGVKPTEAAKTVGYSELRAAPTGSELVKNRKIQERIAELSVRFADQVATIAAIDRKWVMDKLRENLEMATALKQGSVVNRALELIGKELGMFIERREHRFADEPLEELPYDQLATIAGRTNSDHSPESIN